MAQKLDMKKIILLLLLIVILVIGGILLIDFTGRILGVRVDLPFLESLKSSAVKKAVKQSENIYLLEREEIAKKEDRVLLLQEVILNRDNELKSRELEVEKKYEAILERERELDKKVAMLDERDKRYTDKQKNIREQAVKLYNMPPTDAAYLLEKQTEIDIIDILRGIDLYSQELGSNSTSPYILTLIKNINGEKAANVLAKLKFDSSEEYTGVDVWDDPNIEVPPTP